MAMRPSRNTGGRQQGGVRPVYEEFKPMSEWIQDEDSDKLIIQLPGFKKEDLHVSTEGRNILRVRGERLIAGNKWQHFQEDYHVPDYCNLRGTRARFELGTLSIKVPRKSGFPLSKPTTLNPKDTAGVSPQLPPPLPLPVPPRPDIPQETAEEQKQQPQAAQKLLNEEKPPRVEDDTKSSRQDPVLPLPRPRPNVADQTHEAHLEESIAAQKMLHDQEKQPNLKDEGRAAKESPALPPLHDIPPRTRDRKKHQTYPEAHAGGPDTDRQHYSERARVDQQDKSVDVDKSKLRQKGKVPYRESMPKQTTVASSSGTNSSLESLKNLIGSLGELDEERKLLVNVGAAVLVIVALGTQIYNSIRK